MAGYRRSRARRSTSRSYGGARRASSTRRASPTRRRASSRRTGGRTSRTQVVRLEIVQPAANPVARPEIGVKPASAPRKAMF